MVLWGFESANERIYHLMNKGKVTNKQERLTILQAVKRVSELNQTIWL